MRSLILLTVCTVIFAASCVHGSIFFITDTNDSVEPTSLRGAIIAANASGGDNLIILTSDIYRLTIPGVDEYGSFTGDLDITNGSLTIMGASYPPAVIDATGLDDRVFQILSPASLALDNLVIQGGAAPGNTANSGAAEAGGAIYNMGTLVLENCVISNNAAGNGNNLGGSVSGTSGGGGGGIYNLGFLTMINSSVWNNSAGTGSGYHLGGDGGGIYNSGWCVLNSCTIHGNSSGPGGQAEYYISGGQGGSGGGIYNSGTLTLIYCTLSGNSTGAGANGTENQGVAPDFAPGGPGGDGGNGGGLDNAGDVWLTYCTVCSNSCGIGGNGAQSAGGAGSGGSGAGIYNGSNLSLNTCTIGGNTCGGGGEGADGFNASGAAGGSGGGGGGICNNGSLNVTASTIVLNQTGFGGVGGNTYDGFFNMPSGPGGEGGNSGNGGGILNTSSNSAVVIRDSLIALNTTSVGGVGGTSYGGETGADGSNGTGVDGKGNVLSQGFNLISQIDGLIGLTNGVNGDLAGNSASPINPLLSPLQTNGGTTFTYALLPGSPAIDAGDDGLLGPPENITVDQCGNPRKSGAHVDIGAFEYNGMLNGAVLSPLMTKTTIASGGLQFTFNAASGLNYSVWASTDLNNWMNIGSAAEISSGWFLCQDLDALNHDHRYYQIRYP